MKLTLVIIPCLLLVLTAGGQSFEKLWETDTMLLKPESVLFDQKNDVLYVSNINGEYLARDGNGFISKINRDGTIAELKWVTGLNNPQGLGMLNGKLYVADIDEVVIIDIALGTVEKKIKAEGAIFLNDITSDDSAVFISDCRKNVIYKLAGDTLSVWLEGEKLVNPNGVLCTEEYLYILNMGNGICQRADYESKVLTEVAMGIRNADGIVSDGNAGYFVTGAWQGEVFHIDQNGNKKLVIDLGLEEKIAADPEFIAEENLLLIPTLGRTVVAYKLIGNQ